MRYSIYPLTQDYWPALENLFSKKGTVSRCWCMFWRIGSEYRNRMAEQNRADLEYTRKA